MWCNWGAFEGHSSAPLRTPCRNALREAASISDISSSLFHSSLQLPFALFTFLRLPTACCGLFSTCHVTPRLSGGCWRRLERWCLRTRTRVESTSRACPTSKPASRSQWGTVHRGHGSHKYYSRITLPAATTSFTADQVTAGCSRMTSHNLPIFDVSKPVSCFKSDSMSASYFVPRRLRTETHTHDRLKNKLHATRWHSWRRPAYKPTAWSRSNPRLPRICPAYPLLLVQSQVVCDVIEGPTP